MGSVVSATGESDVCPFRLGMNRGKDGVDVLTFSSKPHFNAKHHGDQVGQYRNLLIWMHRNPNRPCAWLLPAAVRVSAEKDVTFVEGEKTWLAIRTFGLNAFTRDSKAKEGVSPVRYFSVKREDAGFYVMAVEVGEAGDYDNLAAFKRAVFEKTTFDFSAAAEGRVTLTGSLGHKLEMTYNRQSDLPLLTRDGTTRNWDDPAEWALWRTPGGDLVSLGWKAGILKVKAGGHAYEGSFKLEGYAGPDVMRDEIEKAQGLKPVCAFENR
jgi:hypothetical protein